MQELVPADGLHAVLCSQLADFTSEVREIEASPYARQLQAVDLQSDVDAQVITMDTGLVRKSGQKQVRVPAWAPKAAEHLKRFQETWGAGGGISQAAGSKGHEVVHKVGKFAG